MAAWVIKRQQSMSYLALAQKKARDPFGKPAFN